MTRKAVAKTERAKFERWAETVTYPHKDSHFDLQRFGGGYWNLLTHYAWVSWQASARARRGRK